MGFLDGGVTLSWEDVEEVITTVKTHGVLEFINVWQIMTTDLPRNHKWGDEVEFSVFHLDDDSKSVQAFLETSEILDSLVADVERLKKRNEVTQVDWRPEYGRWMIEAVPGSPYDADDLNQLLDVEKNMLLRRQHIEAKLAELGHVNTFVFSVTHFPMLGCINSIFPKDTKQNNEISRSLYTCDELICQHARFGALTKNIRDRKGRKVDINVPVFRDAKTLPLLAAPLDSESKVVPSQEYLVHADSMAFGMGQCCLQVTFQMTNISDAYVVYDALLPFTPILLALTAATPILRGHLTSHDVRWNILEQSVDDRTDEELGLAPSASKDRVLPKSRYGSISSYLSPNAPKEMNDIPLPLEQNSFQQLLSAGIPESVARHVAHLFTRDPLVVYEDKIDIDDTKLSDHFENIQSTNWQSLRFKPPPIDKTQDIGWRVEFRTMELQFTEFENAAYSVFVNLLIHVIREGSFDFYMPISKIDENMERAHCINSVVNNLFWFRENYQAGDDTSCVELTINELMNGKPNSFKGIIPLLRLYLDSKKSKYSSECLEKLNLYLDFIGQRASGALQTNATWIREFVQSHSAYEQDSVVSHEIVYDLFKEIGAITRKQKKEASLYASFY